MEPSPLEQIQKLNEEARKYSDIQEQIGKRLVEQFDRISKSIKSGDKGLGEMRNFSKEILRDTKARGYLMEGLNAGIEKAHRDLISAKLKEFEFEDATLEKRAEQANAVKKISDSEKEQLDLKKQLAVAEIEIAKEMVKRDGLENNIKKQRQLYDNTKSSKKKQSIETEINKLQKEYLKTAGILRKYEDDVYDIRKKGAALVQEEIEAAKARLQEQRDALKLANLNSGYIAHLKDTATSVLGVFGGISGKMASFASSLKSVPAHFLAMDLALEESLRRFILLDETAEQFRRDTGFSISQMTEIRKGAEKINVEFMSMGVTMEAVYKSAKALTDVFGRTSLVTEEAMKNISLMKANLNVAEEDSASVLSTFQGLGGVSQKVAMNIMKVGAGMSEKIGVPFQLVMHDIANASEDTFALLGANPSKLMKSAIAARTFGMELNKLSSTQRKLLDYSSSINDELSASALLGRNISFQKARQYAYDNDMAKAAEATLETIKSAGDFNAMDLYQRSELAKAAGMELKDLTKMMAIDAQREEIKFRGNKQDREKLAEQEKILKQLESENDLSRDGLVMQNERAIKEQKMQGQITKLKNMLQDVLVSIGDILEPIITPIVSILLPVLRGVAWIIKGIAFAFKVLVFPINLAVDAIKSFGEYFQWVGEGIESVSKIFKDTFGGVENWIKGIAGSAGLIYLLFWGKSGISNALGKLKNGTISAFKYLSSPIKSIKSMFGNKDFIGPIQPKISDSVSGNLDKISKSGNNVKSGTGIKDFLINLSKGLKALGDSKVALGAINLLLATPGLITIIPGALLAGLIPKKAGDNIENFLVKLASGMNAMGTGKISVGSANLLLASAGLIAIIPGAIAASILGVIGKPIETGLKYLAKGIGYMGNSRVFMGALGIAAVGASIIPLGYALKQFTGIDWESVKSAGIALGALSVAAGLMGIPIVNQAILLGALAIGALGLALVPFGVAAMMAGKAAQFFADSIKTSIDPIVKLSGVDLTKTALGIAALSVSLAAFGYGSAAAGMGSFISNFLGGNPIAKLEKLASVGDKLKPVAESITAIAVATGTFSSVNSFSDAILRLSNSIGKLNDQLASVSTSNLEKLSTISNATATIKKETKESTASQAIDTSALEAKFDTLIGLMTDGRIIASVDLDRLSSRSARSS